MLNLTLERKKQKITLDALMRNSTITKDPKEINLESYEYYSKVFKRRDAAYERLTLEWKKEYEPIEDIDENIYTRTTWTSTNEELKGIIAELPNGKAAGLSGIPYELLKKMKEAF